MKIGTMFLGEVDELAGESIQTKFFVLGLPLVPMASYYVTRQRVGGVDGIEIGLHGKSVGFGYLRVLSWIGALIWGVIMVIEPPSGAGAERFIGPVALLALAIVSTFAMGGVPKHERLGRIILRAITGVGAPPELLPADVHAELHDALVARWREHAGGRSFADALVDAPAAQLPLAYAVARYSDDRAGAIEALERFERTVAEDELLVDED